MGIRIRITVKSCTWIPIEVKSQIQDSDQSEKPDEDLDTHQSDADSQHWEAAQGKLTNWRTLLWPANRPIGRLGKAVVTNCRPMGMAVQYLSWMARTLRSGAGKTNKLTDTIMAGQYRPLGSLGNAVVTNCRPMGMAQYLSLMVVLPTSTASSRLGWLGTPCWVFTCGHQLIVY
jgi:hypothetical protein